jgi:hypothetical protein
MTRASKKPAKGLPKDEASKAADAAPSKVQVQFGPSPSAPGSRLKRAKGA